MIRSFADVLDIYNGRNQKKVENPNGKYPIYGSGGVMGYANDFICPENTVLIGRKGSINNPIFVDTPLWNVDTAFGLIAKQGVLLPKYLYYFCVHFDFEKLNTTVTIPSLTKVNLLKIQIPVPDIAEQHAIAEKLDKIQSIIKYRKQQLEKLDELIKARFVEMTRSDKSVVPTRMGDIASYINGYAFKPTDWTTSGKPIIRIHNLNDMTANFNYFDGELDEKYSISDGDILVSWATHLEAYVWNRGDAWLNQHIFKAVFDKMIVNKIYFVYATEEALRQAFKNAHGFKPTMEHIKRSDFENAIVQLPSIETQNQFAVFVEQTNKSKFTLQSILEI